jgi:Flp pilus assembly protein TadG
MSFVSFARHMIGAVRRFPSAQEGNIAAIFAIALLPVMAFVGAAVDYSRANMARSAMQGALDSAALMVSKDLSSGTIRISDIRPKAETYFNALYHPEARRAELMGFEATYTVPTSGSGANIKLSSSGRIWTDFMRVVNFKTMEFGTSSTAVWGNTRTRVAMVLDNTGSMEANGKMPAMKQAAKTMIDTLSTFNNQAGDVYISIIPFTKDVNVGKDNVNAPWINWTEWEAEPPVLPQNNYPIRVRYNNINYTWADIGPGAPCPFDTIDSGSPPTNRSTNTALRSGYGFACMNKPATQGGTDVSNLSTNRYLIPPSGRYAGMICPGPDNGKNVPGKADVFYNGCYTSVVDQTTVVASGANAVCPTGTPNCVCSGTGSATQCVRTTYRHYWRSHPTDPTQAANAAPGHNTWTGCVNDRDQNFDTQNTAPGSSSASPSSQFYAEQWRDCLTATVFGMSNDWTRLNQKIAGMEPAGKTNQAIGLAWGWQSLSTTNGPIAAPAKDGNFIYKDYVELLSDGLNTQNRWNSSPPQSEAQAQANIDARQKLLCDNIKQDTANPVTIFTIQVNVGNADPKSQVLQDCATNGNFQMITSSTQTADAFNNVVTQISKLRVAR